MVATVAVCIHTHNDTLNTRFPRTDSLPCYYDALLLPPPLHHPCVCPNQAFRPTPCRLSKQLNMIYARLTALLVSLAVLMAFLVALAPLS